MSDSTFPFTPPAEPEGASVEPAAATSRRRALVVGGVAGALVLAAGGYLLLGGGGNADQAVAPVAARAKAAPAAPAASPAAVTVVPAAATEQVGRNPFKALVLPQAAGPAAGAAQPAAGTATGATSGTTGGASTATTSSGGTQGGTSTGSTGSASTGGAASGTTTPAPQPTQAPKYISVVAVDAGKNQVTFLTVDRTAPSDKQQQNVVVKPGEVFATYFKLLGYGTLLDANNQPRDCTDLQYGDNRIKLCKGESYQVG